MLFRDRSQAGAMLGRKLIEYRDRPGLIVLALPRGGVPVAFEVCRALNAPLDVMLVRKLGVPGHEELAMGAVASGGPVFLNQELIERLGIPRSQVQSAVEEERSALQSREELYRKGRPAPALRGRTVILVDDGLATGASMKAAVSAVKAQRPSRIVVAVPVAPTSTRWELEEAADDVVCVATPEPFDAVSRFYEAFPQTSDEEVQDLLARARRETVAPKLEDAIVAG